MDFDRHGGLSIQGGAVGVFPHLGDIHFSCLRWVFGVGDGEAIGGVTGDRAGEAFDRQFFDCVGHLDLCPVDLLGDGEPCEGVLPVVAGIELDWVADGGGLTVDGLGQLDFDRHGGLSIQGRPVGVLPHLFDGDVGGCWRVFRVGDGEPTGGVTGHGTRETVNGQLLNCVLNLNLCAVDSLCLRQVGEGVCPVVVGIELDGLANGVLFAASSAHELNLDRNHQFL